MLLSYPAVRAAAATDDFGSLLGSHRTTYVFGRLAADEKMEDGWAQMGGRSRLASLLGETLVKLFKLDDRDAVPIPVSADVTDKMFQFQCKSIPSTGIIEYLCRLVSKTHASEEAMMVAMSFVSRLSRLIPRFPITILTIHRVMLVAIMVASKFYDDLYSKLSVYADWGGVEISDLCALEIDFLYLLNFDLALTGHQYSALERELLIHNPLSPLHDSHVKPVKMEKDVGPGFFFPAIIDWLTFAQHGAQQGANSQTPLISGL